MKVEGTPEYMIDELWEAKKNYKNTLKYNAF